MLNSTVHTMEHIGMIIVLLCCTEALEDAHTPTHTQLALSMTVFMIKVKMFSGIFISVTQILCSFVSKTITLPRCVISQIASFIDKNTQLRRMESHLGFSLLVCVSVLMHPHAHT